MGDAGAPGRSPSARTAAASSSSLRSSAVMRSASAPATSASSRGAVGAGAATTGAASRGVGATTDPGTLRSVGSPCCEDASSTAPAPISAPKSAAITTAGRMSAMVLPRRGGGRALLALRAARRRGAGARGLAARGLAAAAAAGAAALDGAGDVLRGAADGLDRDDLRGGVDGLAGQHHARHGAGDHGGGADRVLRHGVEQALGGLAGGLLRGCHWQRLPGVARSMP